MRGDQSRLKNNQNVKTSAIYESASTQDNEKRSKENYRSAQIQVQPICDQGRPEEFWGPEI